MKLYLNKTSPYARLVMATAHEAGVAERIEPVWLEPWDDAPALLEVNPAGKVPTLVTDQGVAISESGCICDCLCAMTPAGRELLPLGAGDRASMLQRLGLGRSAIDCAFSVVIHKRFNNGTPTVLSERWLRALPRIAGVLDPLYAARKMTTQPDLGDLAVAVAFDYIGFRLKEQTWRNDAPHLRAFVDGICERHSMQLTRPE